MATIRDRVFVVVCMLVAALAALGLTHPEYRVALRAGRLLELDDTYAFHEKEVSRASGTRTLLRRGGNGHL